MKNISEDLRKVAINLLEESAFIFSDSLCDDNLPEINDWDAIGIEIKFSGYLRGSIHLWTDTRFAKRAAANMLGYDEDNIVDEKAGIDALGELLNVISGNLLTTVYGNEPVFDLTIPSSLLKESLSDDYAVKDVLWLSSEDSTLLFVFREA